MDESSHILLESGLRQLGLKSTPDRIMALLVHLDLVIEWNTKFNLTAIKDPKEMIVKHVIDSASILTAGGSGVHGRVLDVGTGAGYPGVVVKCLVPDVQLVLLESLAKRCRFLEEVGSKVLPLLKVDSGGYEVRWGRAEDFGQRPGYREAFDLVTARAVAELRILAEYCLPFCRVGGQFMAMKGPGVDHELAVAEASIHALGGQVIKVSRSMLPDGAGERSIVIVKKVRLTPRSYPRRSGTPTKSPL